MSNLMGMEKAMKKKLTGKNVLNIVAKTLAVLTGII